MLYRILKPIVRAVVQLVWHPGITGAEHLPRRGPAILASNHVSWTETVFMPAQLPRVVHFLAKSDLMSGRSLRGRAVGALLRGIHLVPTDRGGGTASSGAVRAALSVLRDGGVLGIYPEGTRSPDGRLYRGKTGAARIAIASGAPLIPVVVHGADEAMRGRRLMPRRRPRIIIELGAPIDPVAAVEGIDARQAPRELTDLLMRRLQEMSGREYVPEYAADAKRRLRAEQDGASPSAQA